jgi:hypothetical protein
MRRQNSVNTLYIGLVGLWVAHQAQSLISIGHIGVAVWGWVFSGLIIGYEIHGRDELKTSDQKIKNKVKPTNAESQAAKVVIASTAGLAIGLLVALPPFVTAQRHYNSFKSGNGEVIKAATISKPHNRNNFFYTVSVFQANNFSKEALELAEQATEYFPNSYNAWKLLLDLSPEGSQNRERALERLHFLDPKNPLFSTK